MHPLDVTPAWKQLLEIAELQDNPTLAVLAHRVRRIEDPQGYAMDYIATMHVVYAPAVSERLGVKPSKVSGICRSLGYKMQQVSSFRCWVKPDTKNPRMYLWTLERMK